MPNAVAILALYRDAIIRFDIEFDTAQTLAREFLSEIDGDFSSHEAARLSVWEDFAAAIDDDLISKFSSQVIGEDLPYTQMLKTVSWLFLTSVAFSEDANWPGYTLQIGIDYNSDAESTELEVGINPRSPYIEVNGDGRLFCAAPSRSVEDIDDATESRKEEVIEILKDLRDSRILARIQDQAEREHPDRPADEGIFSIHVTYGGISFGFDIPQEDAFDGLKNIENILRNDGIDPIEQRPIVWQGLIDMIESNRHVAPDSMYIAYGLITTLALNAPGRASCPNHTGFHLKIGAPPHEDGKDNKISFDLVGPYTEYLPSTQACEVVVVPNRTGIDVIRTEFATFGRVF